MLERFADVIISQRATFWPLPTDAICSKRAKRSEARHRLAIKIAPRFHLQSSKRAQRSTGNKVHPKSLVHLHMQSRGGLGLRLCRDSGWKAHAPHQWRRVAAVRLGNAGDAPVEIVQCGALGFASLLSHTTILLWVTARFSGDTDRGGFSDFLSFLSPIVV